MLEAKNLYITKKRYHPRCVVKIENLLNSKTKECKTDISHPVWNHSFERYEGTERRGLSREKEERGVGKKKDGRLVSSSFFISLFFFFAGSL